MKIRFFLTVKQHWICYWNIKLLLEMSEGSLLPPLRITAAPKDILEQKQSGSISGSFLLLWFIFLCSLTVAGNASCNLSYNDDCKNINKLWMHWFKENKCNPQAKPNRSGTSVLLLSTHSSAGTAPRPTSSPGATKGQQQHACSTILHTCPCIYVAVMAI